MNNNNDGVILITGGAGFLGQHIVRELQTKADNGIVEIRILDLKPYQNYLHHKEAITVTSIVGNICNKDEINNAFDGVSCVFHCAADISQIYPSDLASLTRNNVQGTKNIISLCHEKDISQLIYTSTAEVAYVPYFGNTCISVIVNQTESRATPTDGEWKNKLPDYAASKLEAEDLVLKANRTFTNNGLMLKTIALRPPLIYGEGDSSFISSIINVAHKFSGNIPKIAGAGGKQQTVYAGNVAWGHVCAMRYLQNYSESISGLPVFITDDTSIVDTTRLCERLTTTDANKKTPLCRQTWWSIPLVISLVLALLLQSLASWMKIRLPVKPCFLVSYLGSIIMLSRLRASIHMGYTPAYTEDEAIRSSSKYYTNLYKTLDDDTKQITYLK